MTNVLAIGAHFDDIEIGCGGALAWHRARGDEVAMFVATRSDYSHWRAGPVRDRADALAEGQAAAAVLGATLVTGAFPTKGLTFDVELIETVERVIVERAIDVVYTHWMHDVHQDHAALGRATLAAARNVTTLLMYRSNWYVTPVPWTPTCFVDISAHVALKERALRCHAGEVARRGEGWLDHWRNANANAGRQVGVAHAEEFVAIKVLVNHLERAASAPWARATAQDAA